MEVDPYLIAPTLILGMSQRLVSKLCPDTGKPIAVTGSIKAMVDKQFADLPAEFRKEIPSGVEMFEAEPTAQCPNGIKGRIGVFEMFKMNSDIEQVILKNPVESEVFKVARKDGLITMKEDAIIKSMKKIIPFEEINQL